MKNLKLRKGLYKVAPSPPISLILLGKPSPTLLKETVVAGRFKGITLPSGIKQYFFSQYAYDSSLMVKEGKRDIDESIRLLKKFNKALGMDRLGNIALIGSINILTNLSG